ncbi:transporter substrate-binding domain-containing protein [Chrysiogenes arsenatis]|uniref:transporter substrate-binding domain-containing protein n=1 Tax=Chrysiogenes arsenatis TaxID=309797 RepID=UPI000424FA06|nr:transporter substrate-binding domain-containing protein [Chrysiogenes arsenatis]
MRLILSGLLVFILLLTLATSVSAQSPKLIVGMELAYPPFEMTDQNGKPSGISVDMAYAIGAYLNREVVIQNVAFDGLIPALRTGKIDIILSSMTATKERAQVIAFSEPYLTTGLCLLLNLSSTAHSLADVDRPGATIAVKKGTTGHVYATQNVKHATLLVLDKEATAVLEVIQGKVDAFVYDQMSIYSHWQRNKETTRAILKPFQQEQWAIGVKKGNEELLAAINHALAHLQHSGLFEALGDTYLAEQKKAFKALGYGFYF